LLYFLVVVGLVSAGFAFVVADEVGFAFSMEVMLGFLLPVCTLRVATYLVRISGADITHLKPI
jgi:hypothetical protein